VHNSDLEIPFVCDSYKSQEQFAVFFAPLGTMYAVVNHIKNVFKHKKKRKREQKNVTNAAEKNTEKRKQKTFRSPDSPGAPDVVSNTVENLEGARSRISREREEFCRQQSTRS
jgi:hypothetical protein